ncbi:sugar ABC transporter substrate-binding protein [Bacillus sp. AFS002410]|uniref:sugar-binding protein n=1 Tax=Bacillus sp. AFS002410 TaxID=2033481 RepID=UPI000BEF348E|nr:sugar-binding protein [Bacillus sp. AFS002410]PEJ57788.1 sugar ABC transporter substrate-binding protein [Bacillus sp. AFS002410]
MEEKKWSIILSVLFLLFVYVLIHFEINARNIENSVQKLQDREVEPKKKLHFVLISQEFDNPYWRKVQEGADVAAEKYGVNVEYIGPLRTSPEEQIKLLEKAIASQVDGIIVQSLDENTFSPVINKAVSQHIPVITIDTDAPKSKRIAYVGTNNFNAGEQLGRVVVEETGGVGKIGVIIGSEKSESQQARLNGFLNVVKKNPNLVVKEIESSNISIIQAKLQAENMMRNNKDISIMVGTSALDAIGILNASKNLKLNQVEIFGFDNIEGTLQAVQDDSIKATVIQKPYEMGYQSVGLLIDSLHGKAIHKENFTPTEVVTKETLIRRRNVEN